MSTNTQLLVAVLTKLDRYISKCHPEEIGMIASTLFIVGCFPNYFFAGIIKKFPYVFMIHDSL